jgi:hypothetical protein
MNASEIDVPVGRVEFLGQIVHVVEHNGRFAAAMTDDTGRLAVAFEENDISAASCRRALRRGIDLLFDRAAAILQAKATNERGSDKPRRTAVKCRRSTQCRGSTATKTTGTGDEETGR